MFPYLRSCLRFPNIMIPAFVLYLLSQAPLLKIDLESRKPTKSQPFQFVCGYRDPDPWQFRPANWLFDNTSFRHPLLFWARLWGVENEMGEMSYERSGECRLRTKQLLQELTKEAGEGIR